MNRQRIAVRALFLSTILTLSYTLARGEEVPPADTRPENTATEPLPVFPLKACYTWLPGDGADGFQVQDVELSQCFALSLFGDAAPLVLTPAFALHLWDGPDTSANVGRSDLPPRAYDLSLDIGWRPCPAEWLFLDLGITPGLYTDFDEFNEDSFRLRGRALGILALSRQFQFVAGLLYVNRNNTKILPAGGILWNPNEDTRLELVFPQPKVSRRVATIGCLNYWAYVTGEFGGGAWTVERAGGVGDSVDYRDIRVIAGLECVGERGAGWRVEVGYVFGRTIDFVSATPDFDPADTLMLRAGLNY